MAFNINEFRSQMVGDGARPNLFQVEMTFPTFAERRSTVNAQSKISFMCKSAQLPGSTVNAVPVQYFGRELKFAGNRVFADWTITVINDEDFIVRTAFERWLNGLNHHVDNVRNATAVTPVSYTRDALVHQYGKAGGNPIKSYKFIGMFPTDVSPIDVDWGSNDTIEEFTVTLSYQWWESVEVTDSP